jgi:hypothetical protein
VPDYPSTATAAADGTATVTFAAVPTGLVWVVGQIGIETLPPRNGSTATVRKNGRYITSTALGSGSSASGPPFISISSHDVLTVQWAGMTQGDTCAAILLYSEYIVGTLPGSVTVV